MGREGEEEKDEGGERKGREVEEEGQVNRKG